MLSGINISRDDSTELQLQTRAHPRPSSVISNSSVSGAYNSIKRKTSQLFEVVSYGNASSSSSQSQPHNHHGQMAAKLRYLVAEYKKSDVAKEIKEDRESVRSSVENSNGDNANSASNAYEAHLSQLPDVATETTLLRGRKRASWGTQFRILSGRAFKNLYRDPALLMAHYLSAVVLACESCYANPCCSLLCLCFLLHSTSCALPAFLLHSCSSFLLSLCFHFTHKSSSYTFSSILRGILP